MSILQGSRVLLLYELICFHLGKHPQLQLRLQQQQHEYRDYIYREILSPSLQIQQDGLDRWLQTLPLCTPPLCLSGRFAKTEIYVLADQPIWPVRQDCGIT